MTDLNAPEKSKISNQPAALTAGGKSNVPLPLKIAVFGMGLALVVLFAMVGNRFMDRRSEHKSIATGEGVPWIIDIAPEGGVSDGIKSAVLDGKYLTVVIETQAGINQVILIDTRKGIVVGKVRLNVQ